MSTSFSLTFLQLLIVMLFSLYSYLVYLEVNKWKWCTILFHNFHYMACNVRLTHEKITLQSSLLNTFACLDLTLLLHVFHLLCITLFLCTHLILENDFSHSLFLAFTYLWLLWIYSSYSIFSYKLLKLFTRAKFRLKCF